ncbi:hypothetical protein C2S53_011968 [Perilla frutescens var. hirtella]|uniref:DUF7731 domain-containing protein n=1 Tax=Perilla frutescens var. hirtella TaxID=608512 RepID=A0AAD4IS78_PERFH|nr:hypothetical protein C2S53_011968 [Perilla frutescens var. hirtella]
MATSALPIRHLLLFVSTMVYLSSSTCKFGRAYEDDHHLGGAGVVAAEFVPEAEAEGERDDHYFPHEGEEGRHDPEPLFTKALECFNDGYCEEAYRVNENGEVEVPHEYVDEYCNGPCLKETHLVLDCIHQIFKYFVFYNKATVPDVRQTINTACAYGPKRGDFNVAEHIKVYEDDASKLSTTLVVYATVLIMIVGWHVNLMF